MARNEPKSWDDVPKIGGAKDPGPPPPQPNPNEQTVQMPPDFVEGLIYRICVPGSGEFYAEAHAPMGMNPGMVTIIQAFQLIKVNGEEKILQYRHLNFINCPGVVVYLCKPPKWWERVLNKETELPE